MGTWTKRAGVALCVATWAACGGTTTPAPCADAAALALPGGNCMVWEAGPALTAERAVIESIVTDAVRRVDAVMPISGVQIRVLADADAAIPEVGVGGFNPDRNEVRISIDPDPSGLVERLESHLGPTIAHEMHHARRRRAIGYGDRLGQAVVTEGLADHFALEIFPEALLPWTSALEPDELSTFTDRISTDFEHKPYVHATWFFGTDPTVPRWTGYTVGFELVGAWLRANPGARASALFGEPAWSFR